MGAERALEDYVRHLYVQVHVAERELLDAVAVAKSAGRSSLGAALEFAEALIDALPYHTLISGWTCRRGSNEYRRRSRQEPLAVHLDPQDAPRLFVLPSQ